MRGYDGHLN